MSGQIFDLAIHNATNNIEFITPVYGFAVDETNSDSNTCVSYIEDAVGLTPATNTNEVFDGGSWLDIYPFNKVRPVVLSNGEVIAEIDKNNFAVDINGNTLDTSVGDWMIEIPPVYWKITHTETGYEVRWSQNKKDAGYQALAHSRGDKLKDNLYIAIYDGYIESSVLKSTPSTTPTKCTLTTGRRYALKQSGYGILNFHAVTLLQILFVTMFKTLHSQGIFMGKASGSKLDNGTLDTNGMYYGITSGYTSAMKFMGIENMYGNMYTLIDGILLTSDNIYYISDNTVFNNTGEGYQWTLTNPASTTGHILKVIGEQVGGLLPSNVSSSGSTSSYYADYYTYGVSTSYHCTYRWGGSYNSDSAKAGIFCFRYAGVDLSSSPMNTRLLYLAP